MEVGCRGGVSGSRLPGRKIDLRCACGRKPSTSWRARGRPVGWGGCVGTEKGAFLHPKFVPGARRCLVHESRAASDAAISGRHRSGISDRVGAEDLPNDDPVTVACPVGATPASHVVGTGAVCVSRAGASNDPSAHCQPVSARREARDRPPRRRGLTRGSTRLAGSASGGGDDERDTVPCQYSLWSTHRVIPRRDP